MPRFRAPASFAFVVVLLAASLPASASPSPAPAAAAAHPDRADRVHLGIVSCEAAPLFSWPDRASVPSGTAYPPARMGDAIQVIGDGTLATDGRTLYETTIEVFTPYGIGKHFFISADCINAG
ncbi:MAG: hypothetical protein NVS2B3_08190 [Vulcanimicrobiaceae bacterium]